MAVAVKSNNGSVLSDICPKWSGCDPYVIARLLEVKPWDPLSSRTAPVHPARMPCCRIEMGFGTDKSQKESSMIPTRIKSNWQERRQGVRIKMNIDYLLKRLAIEELDP